MIASGIVNDGNAGANYVYAFNTAPGLISQLALTITAAADAKSYDGTTNSTGVPLNYRGAGHWRHAGIHPGFRQPQCRTTNLDGQRHGQ